jgi:hypothetical protein
MMRRNTCRFLIPALLPFLIITTAVAGGWAIVTVKDVPEYAVAGVPVTLKFTVRQHGVTLLDGLKTSVRATASGHPDATAAASPTGNSGEYAATLMFPAAGAWTIRIDSGFNAIETTLLPLNISDAGGPPPGRLSAAARGEQLFVAKGCIGCHRNQEIAAPNLVSVGPDLTSKRFPSDHLKAFLADPSKTLGRSARLDYGQMPNLNLEEQEIAALVQFINRDRTKGAPR